MRVLHVSHTSTVSGGEHSLLTLIAALPAEIEAGVSCPPGALSDALHQLDVEIHPTPAFSATLRLHPTATPRAGLELLRAASSVRRTARNQGATVLHANSIRAGLITAVARAMGAPAGVVHVRDVMPNRRVSAAVRKSVAAGASTIVAPSKYTAEAFCDQLTPRPRTRVIPNPVDLQRFTVMPSARALTRRSLGLLPEAPTLGIIGQITPWKGHLTAVRALAAVQAQHPEARLLIVGEIKFADAATSFDNPAYLRDLKREIAELDLTSSVTFLGERSDVPELLSALDVLLVPSTEEPFGRTVAEAMTVGTPVVATSVGGPPEMIVDGTSGLLAPPGQPAAWTAAVNRLLADPLGAREMAASAQASARERFDSERHGVLMIDVWKEAADESGRTLTGLTTRQRGASLG